MLFNHNTVSIIGYLESRILLMVHTELLPVGVQCLPGDIDEFVASDETTLFDAVGNSLWPIRNALDQLVWLGNKPGGRTWAGFDLRPWHDVDDESLWVRFNLEYADVTVGAGASNCDHALVAPVFPTIGRTH